MGLGLVRWAAFPVGAAPETASRRTAAASNALLDVPFIAFTSVCPCLSILHAVPSGLLLTNEFSELRTERLFAGDWPRPVSSPFPVPR